ncbi:hypothetical protein FGO68_gene6489 [Halteria grandinella]|uniref:Uncharacterized protein n=1 Tax=Halteria grandinella TaxID=5974 RepID=A0A8J8P5S3_HALGN|nr:hypothetical protein FGO68_gene6489 [Halteria grandinella]
MQQQQQQFQLPMMPQINQQNNVYNNNGFNNNRLLLDHSPLVRPMNNPSFLRDTPQSRNPAIQSSISANASMLMKKKKRKKPLRRLIPNFEEELNDDLHLDDDEKVWLQQFGNTHHGKIGAQTASENEAQYFQKKNNNLTSHRGKYNSIEHGYQAMDTDAESQGFMQKRKNNNLIASRNFNNKQQQIYQTQIPTRMGMNEDNSQLLPHIQRNVGSNVQSKLNHYMNLPSGNESMAHLKGDPKSNVKRSQGIDNGYHSFSSTKISEINPMQFKKPLVQLKNMQHFEKDQGILSDTYAGTTTGGEERKNYQLSPIIPLGGGLALRRNNQNLANMGQIRHGQSGTDSITFRDQNEKINQQRFADETDPIILGGHQQKKHKQNENEKLYPKISMINMQIDQSILDQLQNDQLSDAQKHELVFDILKSQLPDSDFDNLNLQQSNSKQPNVNSSLKLGRNLPKQRSKQELLTNNSLNTRLIDREATLHPHRGSMVRVNSQKKKSLSPENEELNRAIAKNLSTSRHVNKYCRHCFLKALQEEQRTKKNHMVIYDANNCRKFIEKIKNMNTKIHSEHKRATRSLQSKQQGKIQQINLKNLNQIYSSHQGGDFSSERESHQNSARMAHLARLNQRNSHNVNSIGSFMPHKLNRQGDSQIDLTNHGRSESMMMNPIDMVTKKKHSYSGDKEAANYTLGNSVQQMHQKDHILRSSTINAGNYTIDIIRKSTPTHGRSMIESAKFLSNDSSQLELLKQANNLMIPPTTTHKNQPIENQQMTLAQLLAQAADGSFGGAQKPEDILRKKTVEISLAPEVIDEFQRRRAKYVIRKNKDIEEERKRQLELLSQSTSPEAKGKKTTYYERCKMRRQQLYGNKSQKILLPPSPPIEFEGPFLNVNVKLGSAPRSVHSVGLSPLEVEMMDYGMQMMVTQRDNSAQIEASLADHSVQMQVDLANANMQTTQHQFFEIAIETDPPPGPVEDVIVLLDNGTQTDTIGLWFLKRATQGKYQTYEEYAQEAESRLGLNSARTHDKSVQANTRTFKVKPKPKIIPDPPGPDRAFLEEYRKPVSPNGQLIYHYLFDFNSLAIQVEIDKDESDEEARLRELERLRMLKNAVTMVASTLEPVYGVVKRHLEGTESYPSENYDWRQSGLYQQCLKHYLKDKETVERAEALARDPKNKNKYPDNDFMNDAGYRAAMGIVFTGAGDQHDVISIENSQDASSNFNTKKDIQEQMDDFQNLNPLGHDIYKELEVTYIASILKKKNSTLYNVDQIKDIHQKAITTLTVLTANLIQGETPLDNILNFYKDPTIENVTRLLVRCKKMYDARVDVKKILYQIIMITDLVQILKKKRDIPLEDKVLQLLRKLISQLSNFKHENKMFKAKFIYDGIDKYSDVQELEDAILSGDFYVRTIVVEPPKKEVKEQHTSITPKTQRNEIKQSQVDANVGKEEITVKQGAGVEAEQKGHKLKDIIMQTEDPSPSTQQVKSEHKEEAMLPIPSVSPQNIKLSTGPLLLQDPMIRNNEAIASSLITIPAIKSYNEHPANTKNNSTFEKTQSTDQQQPVQQQVRFIAPSHDIEKSLELTRQISPHQQQQRQVTILKRKITVVEESKKPLKVVEKPKLVVQNEQYKESMKIYEVKQGYAVYGDEDDNSSNVLTHIVSNHHGDQKIYETKKQRRPPTLNESRPEEFSHKNYSQVATPRLDGVEYRDLVNFSQLQRSQESPQKTFTDTQYSMKTMLVGHGGVKVNNTASVNQQMTGSYYSANGPNKESNQTQQEWKYSQQLNQINQSHSQMSQEAKSSIPSREGKNIISIEEQKKPSSQTQQIALK